MRSPSRCYWCSHPTYFSICRTPPWLQSSSPRPSAYRGVRPAPNLSHPAVGVLAFDGLLRRCGRVRRHPGHCGRDRDCRDRVSLGRWRPHSAVLGRVDRVKAITTSPGIPEARLIPGLVLFRWDAPLFFANAELFRNVSWMPLPVHRRRSAGSWSRQSRSPASTSPLPMRQRAGRHSECRGHRVVFRGDEGSSQGQAQALRTLHPFRRETFFATVGEAVSAYLCDLSS